MDSHGFRWIQTISDDLKRFQMVSDGFRWSETIWIRLKPSECLWNHPHPPACKNEMSSEILRGLELAEVLHYSTFPIKWNSIFGGNVKKLSKIFILSNFHFCAKSLVSLTQNFHSQKTVRWEQFGENLKAICRIFEFQSCNFQVSSFKITFLKPEVRFLKKGSTFPFSKMTLNSPQFSILSNFHLIGNVL